MQKQKVQDRGSRSKGKSEAVSWEGSPRIAAENEAWCSGDLHEVFSQEKTRSTTRECSWSRESGHAIGSTTARKLAVTMACKASTGSPNVSATGSKTADKHMAQGQGMPRQTLCHVQPPSTCTVSSAKGEWQTIGVADLADGSIPMRNPLPG